MTQQQSETALSIRPIQFGAGAFVLLLAIYFAVVSLISGVDFTLEQFTKFWYFFVSLALDSAFRSVSTPTLSNLSGNMAHQARW